MQEVSGYWTTTKSTCKVDNCEIREPQCGALSSETKLSIVKNGDVVEVHGDQNVEVGYDISACIVCYFNNGNKFQKDGIQFKQSKKPCSRTDSLSPPVPTELEYDSTKTDSDFAIMVNLASFWTLTPGTCTFRTCEIMT